MRDSKLFENISKLNTFIHMLKSNELLSIYIEKITNNRSKNLKFVNDFDYIALDLLYTSLQMMNSIDNITSTDFEKIDKRELKYYLDKTKGINYFKNQVNSLKDNNSLISYLIKSLAEGAYICNNNSTVRFDNGLIVDSDWLVEFSHFLVTSFNNNQNLSSDGNQYSFSTVTFPEIKRNTDIRYFLKEIKQYEYSVRRKDNKKLSFDNVKYLINVLTSITEYDFKKLQDINSKLANEGFALSINKKKPLFNKEDKKQIEKFLNEDGYENVLHEYIKNSLKCYDSESNIKRRELINSYELLLDLSRAYKCNYTLEECRKLFNVKELRENIECAFAIANFYINFIYDETNLNRYFNYSVLDLDKIKPAIIDYETTEYKDIIKKLSSLNKKTVVTNRRINKYLAISKLLTNEKKKKEINIAIDRSCHELERIVNEIKVLREQLDEAKDENHKENNINKTKLKYIKLAIASGTYYYDTKTSLLTFNVYDKKDYHRAFNLEISLFDFNNIVLSEENRNTRVNFYQI